MGVQQRFPIDMCCIVYKIVDICVNKWLKSSYCRFALIHNNSIYLHSMEVLNVGWCWNGWNWDMKNAQYSTKSNGTYTYHIHNSYIHMICSCALQYPVLKRSSAYSTTDNNIKISFVVELLRLKLRHGKFVQNSPNFITRNFNFFTKIIFKRFENCFIEMKCISFGVILNSICLTYISSKLFLVQFYRIDFRMSN